MALILCIETSTRACSVALCEAGKVKATRFRLDAHYTHAENLNPLIETVMKEANAAFSQLDAVAVSRGPGSYTGLRIGVSSAKGLCYALGIPLIAIDTLWIMAARALSEITSPVGNFLLCPLMDARRMEVYTALFDPSLREIESVAPHILAENSFSEYLSAQEVWFFGDGMEKAQSLLSRSANARFIANIHPAAEAMAAQAEKKLNAGEVENLAYFEPLYLKEFIAGKPRSENVG